jgi:hypothetical protein
METYIKVKEDTEAWNLFNELWTYQDKWRVNREEIEAFLGIPLLKNFYYDINKLTIESNAVPEHLKNQFKKNSIPAVAKSNSKINKDWVELCKKLKLTVVRTSDIAIALNIFGAVDKYFAPMNGDFYFQARKDVSNSWDKVDDWSKLEWAEIITESDFLRLRADWLEKEENRKIA